jgi:diguanylate cyclase (GGDEF)-like protein
MRFPKLRAHRDPGQSQGLVTISLITSLTLVCMVLVLAWGRATHNQEAELFDGNRLVAAASSELLSQTRLLKNSVEDMLAGQTPTGSAKSMFQSIFLVDLTTNPTIVRLPPFASADDFEPFRESSKGVLATVRDQLAGGLRGGVGADPSGDQTFAKTVGGTSNFIVTDGGGFAVSIVPLSEAGIRGLPMASARGRMLAVLGVRPIADTFLTRIARGSGVATLNVVKTPSPNPATSAVPIGMDGQDVYLEWRADRPGDRLLGNIGSMLVSFAALFAGLLAYRSTLKLADAELTATKLAGQDALSGIPNRLLFTRVLDNAIGHAARGGRGFALLYLDLDRFKSVNDTFGHDAGDRMIIAVAQRLQAKLRATDIVARFGGDEFAILQSGVSSPQDCEVLAERLLAAMREPFDLGGEEAFIGASIGISICPRDSSDREMLMRCADLALYNAKRAGRNRYAFFENALSEQVEIRRSTEEELRHAVENNGLELYYQPIVSIDGRKLLAVESLVRWRHPTKGLIPPSDFIGLAEKRGMILQLGEWVMRRACEDARQWPGIRVAVNVSAIQFRHPGFVATVQKILNETGLDPARLELELTETVIVEDADGAENAMFDLRAMGVRLALDDFGTGYSSLIYLRRFAFDKIKIDKSFLESMEATGESAIIVHSVVHLGRSLGLTVVAEGVETSEQHRFLQALGAHELQGYMFSRPVQGSEISRICANNGVMPEPRSLEQIDEDEVTERLAGAA